MKKLTELDFVVIGILIFASLLFAVGSFYYVASQNDHVSNINQITAEMDNVDKVVETVNRLDIKSHLLNPYNGETYTEVIEELKDMSSTPDSLASEASTVLNKAYSSSLLKLNEVKPKVDSKIKRIYDIFAERRYRQRHTARNLLTSLKADFKSAVSSQNFTHIIDFSEKLQRYQNKIIASRVRDNYKARVTPILSETVNYLQEDIPKQMNRDLYDAYASIEASANAQSHALKSDLVNVIGSEKKKSIRTSAIYSLLAIFILALTFFTIYLFIKMFSRRLAVVYSMKKRYRERLDKIQKTVKQNMVLKSSDSISLALVNRKGTVVWSTSAFDHLFPRTKGKKRNWDNLKHSKMVSIYGDTQVDNSYRLVDGKNPDVIISEESLGEKSQYCLVVVSSLASYFSEFNRGIVSSDNLKVESVDQSSCLIDFVIKDTVRRKKINGRKINGLKLEFDGQLPRFFSGDKKLLGNTVESTLSALLQAQDLIDFKDNDLAINYTKKDKQVSIQFKIYGHRINQAVLNQSLDSSGFYTSLADAFEEIERGLVSNYGAVSVSNLSFPNKHESIHCGVVEVSLVERKPQLKNSIPPSESKLRPSRDISEITM